MTGIQTLKALAEEVRDTGGMCALIEFAKASNPSAVLELIGEIDQLKADFRLLSAENDRLLEESGDGLAVLRTQAQQLACYIQDAERYRWLRRQVENCEWMAGTSTITDKFGSVSEERVSGAEDLDKTIDAAMNAQRASNAEPKTASGLHALELTMGAGARSGSIAGSQNQCDGCQAGVPLVNGLHRMGSPGGYADLMACTAPLYKSNPA